MADAADEVRRVVADAACEVASDLRCGGGDAADGREQGWLREQVERSRQRHEGLPKYARPVVIRRDRGRDIAVHH